MISLPKFYTGEPLFRIEPFSLKVAGDSAIDFNTELLLFHFQAFQFWFNSSYSMLITILGFSISLNWDKK